MALPSKRSPTQGAGVASKMPRGERRAKECVLLALDLVVAHEEMQSKREPFVRDLCRAQRIQPPPALDPVADFIDWFAGAEHAPFVGCAEYADRLRAVDVAVIRAALAAWKHSRGQKARKSITEPKKMAAVRRLLGALDIECKESSLAVLWSQLVADGRPTWRSDEWFRSWGARRAASERD